MPEKKTKEQQKISDNNNYYWGYFIQTIESKANNYIFDEYWGIFCDFISQLKNKMNDERSSTGMGIKVEDFQKARELVDSLKEKFTELRDILKPSIVESFLNEIAKENGKDL